LDSPVDILLVDDNPNNLLALEAILGNLYGRFVKAESGMEALKRLLDQDFALIILDIQMPGMDGFETAALIRGRERSRRIPIIFLTAFNRSDAQVQRGYALGAVDFLFKPIVPEVLRAKVTVFVELHRKTEEVRKQAELLREIENKEHERRLQEEKQRWETERLREQVEQERRTSAALARTIEERERAEEALRRTNARLHLLADSANRLLFSADPRHLLHELYRQLSEYLGLEVYGVYLVDGDEPRLHLESHGGVSDDYARDHEWMAFGEGISGEVALRREERIVRGAPPDDGDSDGARDLRGRGVRAFVCYPMIAGQRLIGTLLFGTRTRDHLEDDEIHLLHITGDQSAMALERARLVDELQRRAEALAEADRRKDEFLAMLAHELRNPLVPILTGLKTLQMVEAKTPKLARARDAIERQVRHMVRLVDDLLDVSRVTAGKIELRKDLVDVAATLQQAVATSQSLMQDKQHTLTLDLPPERLELVADPARLTQIVSNLLNNAAKYTDPGGAIVLAARPVGDDVEIRVRDNGRGIRPEMLSQVFELFIQSDRTLDMAQGGLGVGLTLVKRLVDLHGGSVAARSGGDGQGSEFIVRLPGLARAHPPARPHAAPAPAPAPGKLRILVVDDQPDIRETVRDLLELLGHQVEVAEDGEQAVERVLASRPELALIDIGLPGLDGYQVARTLRAAPDMHTRLVAMTGFGQLEDRRRALEAGFEAHLVKPVDLDHLTRVLTPPTTTGA
jgi:signal transduction histidine kinase/DNA-binding response OmpR family regulator